VGELLTPAGQLQQPRVVVTAALSLANGYDTDADGPWTQIWDKGFCCTTAPAGAEFGNARDCHVHYV